MAVLHAFSRGDNILRPSVHVSCILAAVIHLELLMFEELEIFEIFWLRRIALEFLML